MRESVIASPFSVLHYLDGSDGTNIKPFSLLISGCCVARELPLLKSFCVRLNLRLTLI